MRNGGVFVNDGKNFVGFGFFDTFTHAKSILNGKE
jgi:hypothetical protein